MRERIVADIVQKETTGIFLRSPTRTAHTTYVSEIITVGGGDLRRSRSRSNGSSNMLWTASTKSLKLSARTSSEGMRFGRVAKWIRSGFGSDPMNPSHSSVMTNVTMSVGSRRTRRLQRFIMGLMWPLPGQGIATTSRNPLTC